MRSRRRCSMCPAIHINSRSWLRSSSTHEPSDPPLRAVFSSLDEGSTARPRQRKDRPPGAGESPLPESRKGVEKMKKGNKVGAADAGGRPPDAGRAHLVRSLDLALERGLSRARGERGQAPRQSKASRSARKRPAPPPEACGAEGRDGTTARARARPLFQSLVPVRLGAGHSPERERSLMILPQVHLRKPCYDFYFL